MSWLAIGLGSESRIARMGQVALQPTMALRPAPAWTGTAGSGFASTPVDPARTTAKPALHLLTPPQRFTDTLDVGVLAMANDGGSLFRELGIAKVVFHYEGSTLEIAEPRWKTIQTQAGPRIYFGWWVRLERPDTGLGNANLYVEAVPHDPAMQRRVIGPFFFDPVRQLYTHSVTVAPSQPEVAGERYQSIDNAIAHVNGFGAASPNPLITVAEPGYYDITRTSGTLMTGARGYCNITANVPDVFIGKASYTNDAAARIRDGRYKLHLFGPNLSIDMRRVTEVDGSTTDTGINHWIDGITITTSGPDGKNTLIRGNVPARSTCVRSFPYATEVTFREVRNPSRSFKLVRGCRYERISADVANETRCFVFSTIEEQSNRPENIEINAFTVAYSGPEATATLACPGGLHASGGGGLWTLTLGATSHTFDVGQSGNNEAYFLGTATYRGASGVGGYWHQDVVNWLNSFPGVTAVRQIAQDRSASFSTLPGTVGIGWNTVSIKNTTLQIASVINTHGDFYQHNAGVLENVIIAFNYGHDLEAQIFFLSPSDVNGTAAERDVFVVGNAMGLSTGTSTYFEPSNASSQFGRGDGLAASHVVVAHNTMPNQGWAIRTSGVANGFTADAYCIFKNNIARRFVYDGESLPLANLTVDGLLIHADQLVPPGAKNVIRAGDATSLVANFAQGDYRPNGAALTAGFAPAIPTDLARAAMPATAAMGAFAAKATAYAAPTLSNTPEADLIAALDTVSNGQSFYLDFKRAVLANGTLTIPDQSANGNDAVQAVSTNRPPLSFNGAYFGNNDFVTVPISGGAFTVAIAFAKDNLSTNGNMLSDDAINGGFDYQTGLTSSNPTNIFVNGEAVGTRGRFYALMQDAGEVIVVIEDADFAGDTELRIGRPSGALVGEVRRVIAIDQAAFPANLALIRSLAVQVAAIGREEPPMIDPNGDIISIVSAAGGLSGVYDFRLGALAGNTLTLSDLSDNGNNLAQATAANRPTITAGGASFDGTDFVVETINGGTYTLVLSLTKADASNSGVIVSDQASASNVGNYNSGSTNALIGVTSVNGVNVSNRQALFNALHLAGERIITIQNIDAAGDTQLRIGRSTGGLVGTIRKAVLLDHAVHGANLPSDVAAAQTWVAAA